MNIRKQAASIAAIPVVLGMLLVAAPAARAGETVIAKVPFEFTMGEQTFPAGEYKFEVDQVSPGTVLVHKTGSSTSTIALARRIGETVSEGGIPVMMFNAYGERRFISVIQTSKGALLMLSRGNQERSLAKAGATPTVALVRPSDAPVATR